MAYLDDRIPEGIFSHTASDTVARIVKKCEELGIVCRVFPAPLHKLRTFLHPATEDPHDDSISLHPSDLIQWAFNENLCHNGVFVNIDADMLLVNHTDINDLMRGRAFRWLPQHRGCGIARQDRNVECDIRYAWNTILAMDLSVLPNLDEFSMDCGKVCVWEGCDAVDTGGKSHWFISSLPEEMKERFYGGEFMRERGERMFPTIPAWRSSVFELYEEKWLHVRNGGHSDPENLNRFDNGQICEHLMKQFEVI
uniref:Nucleotide-diphospho-sugar transferase domain-containing protein n=1 Tax=Chromera velia CCMP2878 TaxID=1169474 RepID=A0A0G4GU79_9ALVE|eukprot:Cvel_23409.t1-p1 / transcript=Cvel_23409.t1 / gene=Cvel_23409 / organism=Chromera_velia_CCMP2878 / gene_product=hypothetical protein / transcript_product=hypothetical protein / location=Cvel_scaffold2409:2443-5164(-) / protein_length=252 / sequence_SO=supercontig / SO=protein_coding / is_pseudo=false